MNVKSGMSFVPFVVEGEDDLRTYKRKGGRIWGMIESPSVYMK